MTNRPILMGEPHKLPVYSMKTRRSSCLKQLAAALMTIGSVMSVIAQNYSLSAQPVGFVTMNGSVTGGGNAARQIVTTYSELKKAVSDSGPAVIIVSGTIKTTDGDGYGLPIGSHKTIMGIDKNAKIYGGFSMKNVSNIILRNLNFNGSYPNSGPGDCIAVNNSHHVWIDHCSIWDADDGNLDITNASSYCTVSWCKFYYTNSKNGHRLCALIGSGGGDHPEDWGNLKVTYHHNWFDKLVYSRMPRVTYGIAHVYNNYYSAEGNSYCVGVSSYGSALVEKNHFKNVNSPHELQEDVFCYIVAKNKGNVYNNCKGSTDDGKGGSRHSGWKNPVTGEVHPKFEVQPFEKPPYEYTMDEASAIPDLVSTHAGPQADLPSLTYHYPSTAMQSNCLPVFNRATRTLSIGASPLEALTITLYALDGKKVISKTCTLEHNDTKAEISLRSLKNGMYLATVQQAATVVNELIRVW